LYFSGAGELRLTILEAIPDDAGLRGAWNELALKVDRPQVFYTFEWSMAVQLAYRATLQPLVFLSFDDADSLRGVVALATHADASQASFLCANTGDYCDFLSLPDEKRAFVATVISELRKRGIRNLNLTNLPADSTTVAALRRASADYGYHSFARTAYECAQVLLSKLERRPGENTPVLPGKKNLRRALSAMGKESPVRLDHARSWDVVDAILPEFVLAHVARFLATARISNLARRERQVFLKELARLLSESGWIVLTRLMSGDNALAWNYGFQFHDTWFWYQPTFDNNWERHSPGFCLLAKVIEEASDNRALSVVDLGLGAEEYKDRFANSSHKTLYVTLRISMAQHLKEILRYRTAAIIKSFPILEAGIRRTLARLRDLMEEITREGAASMFRRLSRAIASVWSREEILLFEWTGVVPDSTTTRMELLDWRGLALATLQYIGDKATLAYLLRSATRLRDKKAEGFGLIDPEGFFVSFAWITDFESASRAELHAIVNPAPADSLLLFDFWTPASRRDRGVVLNPLVTCIAERMQRQGKKVWAFAAAHDAALIKNLKEAGFEQRWSMLRRRVLGWQRLHETRDHESARAAEVASRI
jgi:CelD/BcsL family acetyltransferase involved in cellulose biosynthesis